jgi:glycosyltransferase involved in cell wall biosynthesis
VGKNPPPLFSVIIPTYNYARYLPRALESVLNQPGDDYEVVVVDDGSTDETVELVRRYAIRANGTLSYAYQENRGPSAARNYGVKQCVGRYLLFLDADDALLPDALDRFRSIIDKDGAVDFAFGGYLWVTPDGRTKRCPAQTLSLENDRNFVRYLRHELGPITMGSGIVCREVFERVQFPEDSRMTEDIVFKAQLLALYTCVSFSEPVVTIYEHADSQSRNVELVRRESLKAVDLLFNPKILPAALMPLRNEFLSIVYLYLFLFFYRRRRYQEAKPLYWRAICACPGNLFKARHLTILRKYLRIVFGIVQ